MTKISGVTILMRMVAEIRQLDTHGSSRRYSVLAPDGLNLSVHHYPAAAGLTEPASRRAAPEMLPGVLPEVLMMHGFGQTARAWRQTAAALSAQGYSAHAKDARGHGNSERLPGGDYQLSQLVDDARAVASRLRQPIAIGASMGGLTALVAEAESPTPLFSALILVDITPRWDARGVDRILKFMASRPDGFDSIEEAAEHIARYLPHRDPRQAGAGLSELLQRGAGGRLHWHWDPALLSMVRNSEHLHDRLMAAARIVTVPTLLISGSHSDVVSEQGIEEFLNAVPHAEHRQVENARHMVAGDENDAFNDSILDFIQRLNHSRDDSQRVPPIGHTPQGQMDTATASATKRSA